MPRYQFSPRALLLGLSLSLPFVVVAACGGGGSRGGTALTAGDARLLLVEAGRIVDVYGQRSDSQGSKSIELFERDVLIGTDIEDERPTGSRLPDELVTYDFIGIHPETLQPRLLIPRELGSDAFAKAFALLDAQVLTLAGMDAAKNKGSVSFPVVPRNAALRLVFSKDLGLSEEFFLTKDEKGRVVGTRNQEAVQLLEIVGDLSDGKHVGDFRFVPTRIAYKGNRLILDPVLLGTEGFRLNVPNNARGLPASLSSGGANIRLALTLEGALRIRGLGGRGEIIGKNLAVQRSIVRDFRSGNSSDNSVSIARGFVREGLPPRILGELAMRLERVDKPAGATGGLQRLTVYKNGVSHDIDQGDFVKIFAIGSQGAPTAVGEVVTDPSGDRGEPGIQHVVVEIRSTQDLEALDPSNLHDYPQDPTKREAWLVNRAPTLVLSTEFTWGDGKRDDPRNFLRFSPTPIPDPNKETVPLNENVSPFAAVIVRFNKPVDLTTMRPTESIILATEGDQKVLADPKDGTPLLVMSQIFDEDGSQTVIRVAPPLGFYLDSRMRGPAKRRSYPYWLHLVGGDKGILDLSGNALDFQALGTAPKSVSFPFHLDTNTSTTGVPRFPDNRVVNVVRRFLAEDEDASKDGDKDWFGAVIVDKGLVTGRATSRMTSWVDDRNQKPSPPQPNGYCPPGQSMRLTASAPFNQAIQNPYNPRGCRLQTVWRENDLSLSRFDPFDFDLDVEQMWWAPFQVTATAPPTSFDIFDRVSLFLGHSEKRPTNCANWRYPSSGLGSIFEANYARNLKAGVTDAFTTKAADMDARPAPHGAFIDKEMIVRAEDAVYEPKRVRRYLPMPTFDQSDGLFTFRDERLDVLGGGRGHDEKSPFKSKAWKGSPFIIPEEGRIGSIALPLLADFWIYPDDAKLPIRNPFVATGYNGSQISLPVVGFARPYFRAFSGGGTLYNGTHILVSPSSSDGSWQRALGGFTPNGSRTPGLDPSTYWMRFDYIKRVSVMTYGFLDLSDPHAATQQGFTDPRLGPYTFGPKDLARFEARFEPTLSSMPAGTKLIPGFRAADVGKSSFAALDPLVAGEAHVRMRSSGRHPWTYLHTQHLTSYTTDVAKLSDGAFLQKYGLEPGKVKLVNFRFIFENNTNVTPAIAPSLETFALVYRIEETR